MSVDPNPTRLSRRGFVQGSLGLALAGGGVLGASACSGPEGGGGGSSAAQSVSILSWDGQAEMKPVLDLFTKQTGVNVSFARGMPVVEYVTTLRKQLQAGDAADVFVLTAEDKDIVPGGSVRDLSDQAFVDVMNSANREFMTVDGKVYGLSLASWTGGILYNKSLLAKAGATSLPDSWSGFLQLCAKLKSLGIPPYYEAGADTNYMSVWGLVGGYFADQGHFPDADIFAGKTTFAQTWTEPLVAWCKLYTQGLAPKSVLGLKGDQMLSDFAKGKVAMVGAGSWNVTGIQKAAPTLSFDAGAIPGFNKGTSYWTGAPNIGYAINAKAKNPDAALKLLQFLATPEAVKVIGTSLTWMTTTSNYTPQAAPGLESLLEGARSGRIYLGVVHWPRHAEELANELTKQIGLMIKGTVKPQQIAPALDKLLKELDGKG